ncbi:hypothetical protein [Reticulibacter mediterranei]|uniref:hypothetical protein n=1 Tax=Reticulibacter mediterranei TaxID=2778369 RepID=UPI001C68BFA9|nr:hypothetical protein [Reticulibacter mediterranei]
MAHQFVLLVVFAAKSRQYPCTSLLVLRQRAHPARRELQRISPLHTLHIVCLLKICTVSGRRMGSSRSGGGAAATSCGRRTCFIVMGDVVSVASVPDGAAEAPLVAGVTAGAAEPLVVPGRLLLTRMFGVGACIVDTSLPVCVLCAEDANKGRVGTEDVDRAGDDKDEEPVGEDKNGRLLPGISG